MGDTVSRMKNDIENYFELKKLTDEGAEFAHKILENVHLPKHELNEFLEKLKEIQDLLNIKNLVETIVSNDNFQNISLLHIILILSFKEPLVLECLKNVQDLNFENFQQTFEVIKLRKPIFQHSAFELALLQRSETQADAINFIAERFGSQITLDFLHKESNHPDKLSNGNLIFVALKEHPEILKKLISKEMITTQTENGSLLWHAAKDSAFSFKPLWIMLLLTEPFFFNSIINVYRDDLCLDDFRQKPPEAKLSGLGWTAAAYTTKDYNHKSNKGPWQYVFQRFANELTTDDIMDIANGAFDAFDKYEPRDISPAFFLLRNFGHLIKDAYLSSILHPAFISELYSHTPVQLDKLTNILIVVLQRVEAGNQGEYPDIQDYLKADKSQLNFESKNLFLEKLSAFERVDALDSTRAEKLQELFGLAEQATDNKFYLAFYLLGETLVNTLPKNAADAFTKVPKDSYKFDEAQQKAKNLLDRSTKLSPSPDEITISTPKPIVNAYQQAGQTKALDHASATANPPEDDFSKLKLSSTSIPK